MPKGSKSSAVRARVSASKVCLIFLLVVFIIVRRRSHWNRLLDPCLFDRIRLLRWKLRQPARKGRWRHRPSRAKKASRYPLLCLSRLPSRCRIFSLPIAATRCRRKIYGFERSSGSNKRSIFRPKHPLSLSLAGLNRACVRVCVCVCVCVCVISVWQNRARCQGKGGTPGNARPARDEVRFPRQE
jgi:hypothetical protein